MMPPCNFYNLKERLFTHRLFLFVYLVFLVYFFCFVFIPFVRATEGGIPLQWDHSGHIAAAHFFKAHLFPWQPKWNDLFYAGFPQDTFYPPLVHYVTGLLGAFFGVERTYLSLCALFASLFPLAVYWFLSGTRLTKKEAALGTFLILSVFTTEQFQSGNNLFSLIEIGLFTNAAGLVLLFSYLGCIVRYQAKDTGLFACATLLFSGILLSHFLMFVAAIIFGFSFLLFQREMGLKQKMSFLLRHYAVSLLICSFWVVPFGAYAPLSNFAFMTGFPFFLRVSFFALIALGALFILLENDQRYFPFIFCALMFLFFYLLDVVELGISMHMYRLFTFSVFLGAVLAVKVIYNAQRKTTKIVLGIILCGALYIQFFVSSFSLGDNVYPTEEKYGVFAHHQLYRVDKDRLSKQYNREAIEGLPLARDTGRLVTFCGDKSPFIHSLRTMISLQRHQEQLMGLFIESAANSTVVAAVYQNLTDGKGLIWGIPEAVFRKPFPQLPRYVLRRLLDSFWINYLLSVSPLPQDISQEGRLIARPLIEPGMAPYYLYRFGDSKFAELVYKLPVFTTEEWTDALTKWLLSENGTLYVFGSEDANVSGAVASKTDSVDVLEKKDGYLKFFVHAAQPVPLYIKMSFFPRWHAYVDGVPAHVYRTSPYMMLVYGSGIIELKYERTVIDYFGLVLSVIGIAWLLILCLRKSPPVRV